MVGDTSEAMRLKIEELRTRREELRLERTKLVLGRNGLLILLWALLAAVSITALIVVADPAVARSVAGSAALCGFLGALVLFRDS